MSDINISGILDELQGLRDINSKRANMSLLGLVFVFILSFSFFLFSDYLSPQLSQNLDFDINRYEDELRDQLNELNAKYGAIKSDLSLYQKENLTEDEQLREGKISPEAVLVERADYLGQQKLSILKELDAIQENRLAALKASNGGKSVETIIATSITRVGAVLLSVFMMQILLGFFRYYTRLSNHYATRVIAFKALGSSDSDSIQNIINSMQPESVTFGKEPQMPFEKVFELLKSAK